MDKSTLKILLAATAIAAGAEMAAAQGPGFGKGMGQDRAMTFETLDADGSGEITAEDLTALREARFAEVDANGDGNVSLDEFTAVAEARAAARASQMFERLDADGDGILSRDALEARMQGGPNPRMIARLDTDDSGGVSAEEFEAARTRMAGRRGHDHDGDRDGMGDRGRWGKSRH